MKGTALSVFCAFALANGIFAKNVRGVRDPSHAKSLCASSGSDGLLIAHEECINFYKCLEGKPVALTCPSNLLYNPDFEFCDWHENVDCGSRTVEKDQEKDKPDSGSENNPSKPVGNSDPSQAYDICAATGSDGILIAHEDCDKFYKCSEGKPVPLKCPQNFLYNAQKEYCDWPENVKCEIVESPKDQEKNEPIIEEDKKPAENSNPSQAGEICAGAGSDGVLISHEDCDKFYKCSEGKAIAQSCPVNLLYNPEMEYCDWPDNVKCGLKIINRKQNEHVSVFSQEVKPLSNSDPSQAKDICAQIGSDSTLIAHEDCSKFYKCSKGKPVALSCPLDLLYNPEKEYCDWPVNVNCKESEVDKNEDKDEQITENDKIPAGNTNPSLAKDICAASGSDGILVAHEDCNKFYKCSEGKPIVLKCATNLLYNAEKEYCDWPENVNCKVAHKEFKVKLLTVRPFSNSDPSQANEICASEKSDGVLVAHEDCSKFYKCSEGKPVALNCPLNLLYNPDLEYCDWPENVDCKSRNSVDTDQEKEESPAGNENKPVDSSDVSNVAKTCAAPGSERLLIAHEDCTKFYKCLEGKPVVLSCPTNLHYNVEKEYCDWPENVQCKSVKREVENVVDKEVEKDNLTSGNDKPADNSQASEICAAASSDSELVSHEECNKFYICSEGKPVKLDCPLNLLYNPAVKYCDWPENVDCGNRKTT